MIIVCDIEANRVKDPDILWCVHCKDVDTGEWEVFERPDLNQQPLLDYFKRVQKIIGHFFIRYDLPVMEKLIPGFAFPLEDVYDTLVISKTLAFPAPGGHSLEVWGERLGHPKVKVEVYDDPELLPLYHERCHEDVEINHKLWKRFLPYLTDPEVKDAFRRELDVDIYCKEMEENGFKFDINTARHDYDEFQRKLIAIEDSFGEDFPPEKVHLRDITPKLTKHGTISLANIKPLLKAGYNIKDLKAGVPVPLYETKEFNPGSVTQIVERLHNFGWKPTVKTKGHLDFLKGKGDQSEERAKRFEKYGWVICDENLATLPEDAPESAHKLKEYLFLKSRMATLQTWFDAYNPLTGNVHGRQQLGTWTHRNAHMNPNMGNIAPELRHLWICDRGNVIVGVDAKSIQMRLLAHYMEDEEFIRVLLDDTADPHQFNADILGIPRRLAKTWYYAWVMGAGIAKQAEILGVSMKAASAKQKAFIDRFPKLKELREEEFPKIEALGEFRGIDGRRVQLGGYNIMSGLLQNAEKIIMSEALRITYREAKLQGIPFKLIAWVHDEFQFEVWNTNGWPQQLAEIVCQALRDTTEIFSLRCLMDGSYHNDEGKETIGLTWKETH